MMYFKACPKCRGDMYITEDIYGLFRECIQCGLIQDVEARDLARATTRRVRRAA